MKKSFKLLSLTFLILLTGSGASCAETPEQIVRQFFPSQLRDAQGDANPNLYYQTSFAVLRRDQQGEPLAIAAGYSSHGDAVFRILTKSSAGFTVAAEIDQSGSFSSIALEDVDGDGSPEVITTIRSATGISDTSILRWDGDKLTSLDPVEPVDELANASLLDLYHDGTLQLVSVFNPKKPVGDKSGQVVVYRYSPSGYVFDRYLSYLNSFVRTKSGPLTAKETIDISPNVTGPFTLTLVNGVRNGADRVSSAHVTINATEIISPNQLNQNIERVTVDLPQLPGSNILEVKLDGKPGSRILLLLEAASKVAKPGR